MRESSNKRPVLLGRREEGKREGWESATLPCVLDKLVFIELPDKSAIGGDSSPTTDAFGSFNTRTRLYLAPFLLFPVSCSSNSSTVKCVIDRILCFAQSCDRNILSCILNHIQKWELHQKKFKLWSPFIAGKGPLLFLQDQRSMISVSTCYCLLISTLLITKEGKCSCYNCDTWSHLAILR